LDGQEDAVSDAMAALAGAALSWAHSDPAMLPAIPAELPQAAALSALDQALWDIAARRRGVALSQALGGARRDTVKVYANINRRTRERSPAAFAASARAAVEAGHDAVKLAPFDEVDVGACRAGRYDLLGPGLDRIAAVRAAIGPSIGLMVDCHWRLDPAAADHMIGAAGELGVRWIECPLPETPENIAAIVRLRGVANRNGMVLAGLETAIGLAGFMPFIRAGAYDVIMPDIKYVGGLAEFARLADEVRGAGIGFSPHNPSGPVSQVASLHFCAATAEDCVLETQFDETRLFGALVGNARHGTTHGRMPVPPGPGLGLELDREALGPRLVMDWKREADSR
jgi:galactonate dehydratase